jgi:hypothetical protein
MRFPPDLITNSGDSVEGKILVVSPQKKNLEVPIKVQAPSWSPFFTAMLWAVGVIVPAIVTLLLGYQGSKLFARWQTRDTELAKLRTFITERYPLLGDLFTVHLATVMANADPDFPERMRVALTQHQVLDAIPDRERKEISSAIARCQRESIKQKLAELFPDWGEAIAGRPITPRGRLRRAASNIRTRLR